MSAATAALDLVTFSQLKDVEPVARHTSWERLAERLSRHAERRLKDGPGWSPVVYEPDATRGSLGVVSVSAVVLDVDHEEPQWALLDGLEYVAHTTWSHQVSAGDDPDGHPSCAPGGDPHWRIVLPLAQTVPAEAWDEFRARARFWLCPNADEGAKDAPRFFWQPACRPGQPKETRRNAGHWLDPAELRALPDEPTPEPVEPHRNGTGGERPGDRYTRETDWLDLLGPRGWVVVGTSGENLLLRRPGKRIGHSATISQHGAGVLYMFTSSAAPFEPGHWYSKFAAYALLEHGDDRSAAARALAERYGMSEAHHRSSGATGAGAAPTAEPPQPSDEPSAGRLTLSGARLVKLSDVRAVPVVWEWKGYIPAAKLTMLDGDPRVGKSCLTVDLAARISTGSPLPDGTVSDLDGPGGVVIMTAEDALDDTVRPRLDAADADPRRIVALTAVRPQPGQAERLPTLADLAAIEDAVLDVNARLVIIDPFMAYLPGAVDSSKDQDVRSILARLKTLAERTGAAILLVRHLNKSQSVSTLYRGGGSIGIIGAARSGLLVARDPDDATGTRRILAPTKSNLGAPVPALAYRILGTGGEIDTARVAWEGATGHSADDLLAEPVPAGERTATADAMAWLHALLLKGARPARAAQRDAQAAEITVKVLRRAREKLSVQTQREGFGKGSRIIWSLSVDALRHHKCPSCLGPGTKGFYVPEGIYGGDAADDDDDDETAE